MSDSAHRDVEIFARALQIPAAQRAEFLESACGGDESLLQCVAGLLRTHDLAGTFLEDSPGSTVLGAPPSSSAGEKPGDHIGRYKLLQQIGEGGCGVVFMAEQEEPVRRRVALKIIKPGMDTRSVIARFEAERQALALMDHPNIAKVFDAGATASGRPYFVMELVRGIKITEYCDRNSLSTEERLGLFVQVCQAVQHAHQKGIIHRDIKPSNILVTQTLEGEALPVVIDFGIAKATTDQRLTDKTLFTAFAMLIGTPAYMSPEQAALTSVDVDTRTDIYSLGVLLYELLTGVTPFDTGELLKSGLDEIRRVIQEEEPLRPSTRLVKMTGRDLTAVAQHRKSEPPRLIRSISGDLDWIAMKALEKDRTRRYDTATGLALDVTRFLSNETISARPPSKVYKLGKLVLRNKLMFAGMGVIAVLLVASLIIVSASLAKEQQARRETHSALQQAQAEKSTAQTEAAKSRQVTRFLEDMLQGVGPSYALGQDTRMLRGILDRTAQRVGPEMASQPMVEAELRGLIGRLYLEIGEYSLAEEMHRAALALNRKFFGERTEQAAASQHDLGDALWKQRKLAEAETAYNEALAIRRQLFGDEHAGVATTLNGLGAVYRRQRKLAESEALTRQAFEIRKKLFGNEHLEVADSLRHLAIVLADRGLRAESEAAAREMLAMRRRLLGTDHPLVAASLADVAWVTGFSGNLAEVEALETQAFVIQQKVLPEAHPDLVKSIYLLGERMRQRGNFAESHTVLNAALSIQRRLLGENHPDVLATLRGLATVLEQQKNWPDAEIVRRELLAQWRKRSGDGDRQVLTETEALCRVLMAQKKWEEAEQLLDQTLTPSFLQEPSSLKLLGLRLDLRGRRGKLQQAAEDAALALKLEPRSNERFQVLATLLAKNGDRARYNETCQQFFAAFAQTTNIYVADQLAKICLLLPNADMDLKALDALANVALAGSAEDKYSVPFFQVCKALSQYRLGNFSEAVAMAQKPLQSSTRDSHSHACAVLAMAHWRLGQKEQARLMLEKGNVLSPPIIPARDTEHSGKAWMAWVYARISLDEAADLLASEK